MSRHWHFHTPTLANFLGICHPRRDTHGIFFNPRRNFESRNFFYPRPPKFFWTNATYGCWNVTKVISFITCCFIKVLFWWYISYLCYMFYLIFIILLYIYMYIICFLNFVIYIYIYIYWYHLILNLCDNDFILISIYLQNCFNVKFWEIFIFWWFEFFMLHISF